MASSRLPFDVELQWGAEPPVEEPPRLSGSFRLFLALLGDLGFSALVFFLLVAGAVRGFELTLSWVQLAAFAAISGVVVGWVEVSCLWFFHRTVGMHLIQVRAETPPTLGRSLLVWLAVLLSAPLLGLPLVLGVSGMRPLERLVGSTVRLEKPGAGA